MNIETINDLAQTIQELRDNCSNSMSEDDIKGSMNIFMSAISKHMGIKYEYHNEITSYQGGRVDSIYRNILFEYKKLHSFNKVKKGIPDALFGRDKNDRGLFHYLVNFSLDSAKIESDEQFVNIITSKIGIGFDGKDFIFCRFKNSDIPLTDYNINEKTNNFPAHLSTHPFLQFEYEIIKNFDRAIKKILLLMRSTTRKSLTANNLLESFSAKSSITQITIKYLYDLLNDNLKHNPRIKTLYLEWERIFGNIFNEESHSIFTGFSLELTEMYNLPENLEIKKILFVLQTYYSIVIKLLIHNLLESLNQPTQQTKKPQRREELTALFSGNSLKKYPIDNFFEIHFFEWFILSAKLDLSYIDDIINQLDLFETTSSIIKPESVEDVLKRMYTNLVPKNLRHLMGEYYTPDWLVDFTIEKSEYNCDWDTTILDPTCGSGAFLTHIIKMFREKHKKEHHNHIVEQITKNIVGFDINPIAVISSKANYILALGDITEIEANFSIPVYMCDSILVPTIHAKQQEEKHSIDIDTIVGKFTIPVFETREQTNIFLNEIASFILNDYIPFEVFYEYFIKTHEFNISIEQKKLMHNFFDALHTLHISGQDGFWATILKNSFAPLFLHDKFDVIVGNPPWISWKSMSSTYRAMTLDIWLSYGIFEKSGYDQITTHDDFAMAVTYVCIDHYLKHDGIMSFVLPQTFVKSIKGGEGFRKFEITRDGINIPFNVHAVYDMVKINPFKSEADNKTSVYVFHKNVKMNYPMIRYYDCFNKLNNNKINYTDTYIIAKNKLDYVQLYAKPINNNIRSPWLTVNPELYCKIDKYLGVSQYKARKGIEPCGAKGIYLIQILDSRNSLIKIENLIGRSRLKKALELGVHEGYIEPEYIYPMVGGRNIDKWGINSHLYMLVPHYNKNKGIYRGVPVADMQIHFNNTYKWLYYFKDLLLETRIRSGKFFNENTQPFYRLDNVGEYTFSKYKVLWREQSSHMIATVVSEIDCEFIGKKTVVTDSKILYVALDNESEAHYMCAILNSKIIGEIIKAYTIDVQKGVDIVKNINIQTFNKHNKYHIQLAELSKNAHTQYQINKENIDSIEKSIDSLIEYVF